jgi:hypothetical protein
MFALGGHVVEVLCAELSGQVGASDVAPHDFSAHGSQNLHLGENEIGDKVVYRHIASVWKCLVGVGISSVAARPCSALGITEAVLFIVRMEPLGY